MIVDEIIKIKQEHPLTDRQVIGSLLQSMDHGMEYVEGDNNYVWFYAIAKYFKPKAIAEQGTRFGYSMKAFVDGAGHEPQEYSLWVYDVECDGISTLDVFEKYFRDVMRINNLHIHRVDTENINSLHINTPIDLAMVDAKHTEQGCFHECNMAWDTIRPGGVIVVDDTIYDTPRNGALRFCKQHNIEPLSLPSFRGTLLIIKQGEYNG